MECFPACKTCTGLCQQPVPPRPQVKRTASKTVRVPEKMPGYIVLVCGTYTTLEEQIAIPGFRKSKRRYWCEKHGHWAHPFTMTERIAKRQEEPVF